MTKHNSRAPVWLLASLFAYVALLAALSLLNHLGADLFWLGAFNLYLPQAIWLVPGIVLAVICLKVAWRWVLVPVLCVGWVLGPVMGLCWPVNGGAKAVAGIPLRVMTWNVKYGKFGSRDKTAMLALMYDIDWNRPDLLILQEASGALDGPLGDYLRKWQVRSVGEFVIASRFPLSELDNTPISVRGKKFGARCRLQIGTAIATVYDVHLDSPRDGLGSMLAARRNPSVLPKAIGLIEENSSNRLSQARLIRESVSRESGPVIVAGDFNSPDPSLVCAKLRRAGLHDAFTERGRGYGYTYGHFLHQIHNSWMRIDHIMMSSQLTTQCSWTGTWKASEHRPVIADLVLHQGPVTP